MAISALNPDDLKRARLNDSLGRLLDSIGDTVDELVSAKLDTAGKDSSDGYAGLDGSGKISAGVLPGMMVVAQGVATLSGGSVIVIAASTPAAGKIFLTCDGDTNAAAVAVTSRTAGVSFTIGSLNVLDGRSVAWMIIG